jgi:hypothetical protein
LVDEPAANPDGLFEAAVDEPATVETPMQEEQKPEAMAAEPSAPSVEERLGVVEAAVNEIKTMIASLLAEETSEVEVEKEVEIPAEMSAGAAFEAVETKILSAVETKFEALSALIKSFGPVAPGVASEVIEPAKVTDFSELRKNPDAMRKHLVAQGILKA